MLPDRVRVVPFPAGREVDVLVVTYLPEAVENALIDVEEPTRNGESVLVCQVGID